MNLLTLNMGSGSQHCTLFRIEGSLPYEPPLPLWEGKIESTFPAQKDDQCLLRFKQAGKEMGTKVMDAHTNLSHRIERLVTSLWNGAGAVLSSPQEIDVVGHRIVHGGAEFEEATLIDGDVEAAIDQFAQWAPLHNRSNLEGVKVSRKLLSAKTQHYAIFDTSFHRTLPLHVSAYAGPYDWIKQGIRRYGFHGTSFQWAARRTAHLMNRESDENLRLLICHLGGGCSLAATVGGRSVDTTMGFTPLDGIPMCTRSGAIDPGIVLYWIRKNKNVDELELVLNKDSGLKGLSGLVGDSRIVIKEMQQGNPRAKLAMDVFLHGLTGGIGRMLASLGQRPDAIVFTDVIGESEPLVRSHVCATFRFLGVELNETENQRSPCDADISKPTSAIKVFLIQCREDWEIARQCYLRICGTKLA